MPGGRMSIVEFRGSRGGYRCGYCGQEDTKVSQGMWAHVLTVQDYQDLIDRGWRRSGKYVYKPTMKVTCCPQYPIRCDVKNFVLNKSHKKVIKKFNKFLNTGVLPSPCETNPDGEGAGRPSESCEISAAAGRVDPASLATDVEQSSSGKHGATKSERKEKSSEKVCTPEKKAKTAAGAGDTAKHNPKPGAGRDPSRPTCKKAKLMRLERWKEKHKDDPDAKNKFQERQKVNQSKSLETFLGEVDAAPAHKLELRLVRSSPRSDLFSATLEESYQVYKKYQMSIHNDPADKVTMRQYTRFLVDSPLEEEYRHSPDGLGSFHQHYLLDGKIIAVGVIDILPKCISSVYLYYDPEYSALILGTYTALREIQFVRNIHTVEPEIEFYYLGYYIHSCPKMKYKGQYTGSYLVCPETYEWCRIEHCRPLLDANKYARFSDHSMKDPYGDPSLGKTLVLFQRQAMPYAMYRMFNPEAEDEEEIEQYSKLVGSKCAQSMLLYRS